MSENAAGRDGWIERSDPLMRSFLRRHPAGPGLGDIDDLLQETRFKLWRTLAHGRPIEHWPAYIKAIVNSVVVDRLQRSARERSLLAAAESSALAGQALVHLRTEAALRERIRDAESAIGALPGPRRAVLQMTLAGYSLGEISALRKWSPKKTYHLYERGVKDLRRRLAALTLLAGMIAGSWLLLSRRPAALRDQAGIIVTSAIGPGDGAALAGRLFERPDGYLDRVSRSGLILNAAFDRTAYIPSTMPKVLASFDIAAGSPPDPLISDWSLARYPDVTAPALIDWHP